MSTYRNLMMSTSMVGANKLVELDDELIEPGKDVLVYDLLLGRYLALKGDTIDYRKFDFRRYETNFDIVLGIFEGNGKKMLHAVACADVTNAEHWLDVTYSAAYSYYMLELDVDDNGLLTFNGSITYSSSNGVGTLSNVVMAWQAGESLENVKNGLADQKSHSYLYYYISPSREVEVNGGENVITQTSIGISVGGYSSNTWTLNQCYRYDENTSSTFEPSTYYRWTGTAYSVVAEEPSDWGQNYRNYYTRTQVDIGTTLKIITKAKGETVPLVTIVDLSKLAVLDTNGSNGIKYNDPFKLKKDGTTVEPYFAPFNDSFKKIRNATPQTVLGSSRIPVNYTTSSQDNNRYNRSYKNGYNFGIVKSHYDASGSNSFVSDGSGGSTNDGLDIMKSSTFNDYVNADAENENAAKMYTYYTNLLNRTSYTLDGVTYDISGRRDAFESWYSEIETLYDAYLMNRMVNIHPTTGAVYLYTNRGKLYTDVKGRLFTLNYNYHFVPCYPPEYNCLCYGDPDKPHFSPGMYAHSEPLDLAVIFRDDVVDKANANYEKINTILNESDKPLRVDPLSPAKSYFSVGDYGAYRAWSYYSGSGCGSYVTRYTTGYSTRPIMTLEL